MMKYFQALEIKRFEIAKEIDNFQDNFRADLRYLLFIFVFEARGLRGRGAVALICSKANVPPASA